MLTNTAVPELSDALILIIDDDVETTQVIRDGLDDFKNVKAIHNGADALEFCRVQTPDLILLNVHMPCINGLIVCKEIREMSLLTRCPIIFLSCDGDLDTEIQSWEAGGSDFLRKPVVAAALKMRVMSHLTSHWHIEIANRLHHTDALTGLNNRYFFNRHVNEQIAYAKRYNSDLSLLLVDINHFKQFNDQFGHAYGDKALKRIASALRKTVFREPDRVCRYSGDEFTVLLPGTDKSGAKVVATKIEHAVEQLEIPFDYDISGFLSVSVGETCLSTALELNESLFIAADQSLKLKKAAYHSQVA